MGWSLKLGRILGITFRVHVTFLLLLLFIFLSVLPQKGSAAAFTAVLFICAIFACVLIHELAHSLIARRFGVEAKSITLLPIGGVATMEEIPEKPSQEIAISIIGPLINLAIAGVLYLLVGRWAGVGAPNMQPDSPQAFFAGLIGVNILLAIFNLIPAFPMDGGRVLRGILALKLDYGRATWIAVGIGQGVAMLFIFYGIFFNWWLALIGLFLYLGAGSEKQQVALRSALRRVPVGDAMVTDFRALRPEEPLSRSVEHIYLGCQEDFPVVGDAGVDGILTRSALLSAIHEKGLAVPVSEVMDASFLVVGESTWLDDAYRRMHADGKTVAAVLDKDQLLGMLSLEGISRYLMLQTALREARSTASNVQ
jgi:Zn-dependent protease